ncbi:MAG: hypothetical protein Q4F00_07950 [bacterium]|nr:hypothetical protein [bacterium]
MLLALCCSLARPGIGSAFSAVIKRFASLSLPAAASVSHPDSCASAAVGKSNRLYNAGTDISHCLQPRPACAPEAAEHQALRITRRAGRRTALTAPIALGGSEKCS